MSILEYPNFVQVSFDMKIEIEFYLKNLSDGIFELSFFSLYLFRDYYKYKVAKTNSLLIVTGEYKGKPFFMTPCCKVHTHMIQELLENYKNWSILSNSFIEKNKEAFTSPYLKSLNIEEDRDNFDYLYLRENFAKLDGKDFHKKKTHVTEFEKKYSDIRIEPLTLENVEDAHMILEQWAKTCESNTTENSDYFAAKEALNILSMTALMGIVLYVGNEPVAWTLAEVLNDGKTAVILFEKANPEYRGSFQYVGYAFARYLPTNIEFINRGQDLGCEGLRHSKMTYRSINVIKKYKISI